MLAKEVEEMEQEGKKGSSVRKCGWDMYPCA